MHEVVRKIGFELAEAVEKESPWLVMSTTPVDTLIQLKYKLAEDEEDYEVGVGFWSPLKRVWYVAMSDTDPPGWTYCHPDFWMPLVEEGQS